MDLTAAIAPKSDQINAEDLLAGPRTFTISEVREGSAEQPVNVHLVESPGKPFRPSKTVLRIFVTAWGSDSSTFAGQRITLYRDPTVRFGGQDVGGIRVSHMSGITKPLKLALTVSKGKRSQYVVQPLADAPAPAEGTAELLKTLHAGMTALGIKDRDEYLAFISQAIGRDIVTTKDLTAAEASTAIEYIKAEQAKDAEPQLPDSES